MKKYFLLFIFLTPSIALAYSVSNKTISKAHVNITSGYYFTTNEAILNPDSCGSSSWYRLAEGTYAKEAFSTVLTAKVSGKKVTFSINGCLGSYPKVEYINIHD